MSKDDDMTLTEFLLARIAEDDAVAHVETCFGGLGCADGCTGSNPRCGVRILAECEAKRRIVEHVEPDALALSPGDPYVLRFLAHPYADHPDYDESWRP